jgi:hypothetical protein
MAHRKRSDEHGRRSRTIISSSQSVKYRAREIHLDPINILTFGINMQFGFGMRQVMYIR